MTATNSSRHSNSFSGHHKDATVSAQLRAATWPIHKRVESVPLLARLRKSSLTVEHYVAMLQRLETFVDGTERIIGRSLTVAQIQALQIRWKAPLVGNDLDALGAKRGSEGTPSTQTSSAGALGMLYVLEGSMLGGKVLKRNIGDTLGEAVRGALSFYSCYEPDTQHHWEHFCGELENQLAGRPEHIAEAIRGATYAFNALIKRMESDQLELYDSLQLEGTNQCT